jgi:acyl dehydratase
VDGGSEWEYFEPVRPGDTITVTSQFVDFYERGGRLGKMLFAIRELKYVNQFENVVALERNTAVLYNSPGDQPGPNRVWGVDDEEWTPPVNLAAQTYFEDVEEGTELPTLEKNPTTRQLVKYAAASVEYPEIHYDLRQAEAAGLPDVIVQGSLKHAFLGHLVTGWMGEQGTLKKLNVQYRGMDVPGTPVYCKGLVTRKYVASGEHLVECDIWMENSDGDKTTPGTALVSLPSRSA